MKRGAWTREKIHKRFKDGYGRGEKDSYIPWLSVPSFSSRGISRRVPSRGKARHHHLLSNVEYKAFLACQWLDGVEDIREQFPLWPLEETEEIARDLGFKHPGPSNDRPQLMTTDLLLTMRNGSFEAISVKTAGELKSRRTLEKLEIERRYWEIRGIRWNLVTERELPEALDANLRALVGSLHLPADSRLAEQILKAEALLEERLNSDSHMPLRAHCEIVDELLGQRCGMAMEAVKHALATRRWETDLTIPLDGSRPLTIKRRT